MNYSKHLFITCIIFSLIFTRIYSSSANKEFITSDNLSEVINSKDIDKVTDTLNEIKKMNYQGEILPFVKDLWHLKKNKHPDLAWNIVTKDIVRVEIANILLQAERNGLIDINKENLHNYILGLLSSNDVYVVQKSIFTLSTFDYNSDVDDILSIAKKRNKITFRAAVITLSKMCNSKSDRALDKLFKLVREDNLKQYIVNTRKRMKNFKERSNWCNEDE